MISGINMLWYTTIFWKYKSDIMFDKDDVSKYSMSKFSIMFA